MNVQVSSTTLPLETARVFVPLLRRARYKGAYGGRGSGKSHFFGENLIELALATPGLRAACLREVQKDLKSSVKLLLEDKIRKFGVQESFQVLESEIRTPGDGLIIFRGMQNFNADSIKSLEGFDVAWVEEAQTFTQYSLDLLRPTIRKPNSEIWFSWNPYDPSDPVEDFMRHHPPPGAVAVEANWWQNPWFPDSLKDDKDYDLRRDPDRYAHIWLGKYRRHSQARVFHNWTIDEFDDPPGYNGRWYYGADWGYAVDPTVLIRLRVDEAARRIYVTHEAYQVRCEIDRTPALFDTVPGSKRWPIVADSARPETISYMVGKGFNVVPAVKGAGSVEDGIEWIKKYDIVVHRRCVHTADEMTHYSWKVDKKTNEVLPILEDKNNHVIDALRYAVEATRRGVTMADYL